MVSVNKGQTFDVTAALNMNAANGSRTINDDCGIELRIDVTPLATGPNKILINGTPLQADDITLLMKSPNNKIAAPWAQPIDAVISGKTDDLQYTVQGPAYGGNGIITKHSPHLITFTPTGSSEAANDVSIVAWHGPSRDNGRTKPPLRI